MNGYTCRYCYLFIIYWVDFVIGLEANEQMSRTKEPQIFRWNSKQCHDNPFIVARYNSFQYFFFVFISILPSLSEFFFFCCLPFRAIETRIKWENKKLKVHNFHKYFCGVFILTSAWNFARFCRRKCFQ